MMKLTSAYRLRGFERDNPSDIERLNLMYYHPQVMAAKGYLMPGFNFAREADLQDGDESMFSVLTKVTHDEADVSYAVVDLADKLVGWIWFYIDKRYPLPKRVAKRLGLTATNSRIYQVSYEKLMSEGWPAELLAKTIHSDHKELQISRKGVILEALKLAMKRLSKEYRGLYGKDRKLALYGYVDPANIASQKVLERNGFVKEVRQYRYSGTLHDLWVKLI